MAKKKAVPIEKNEPEVNTNVTFQTVYYQAAHGNEPQLDTVADWQFVPPAHCGHRPWLFVGMTYENACKSAIDQIAERGAFGEFVVIP